MMDNAVSPRRRLALPFILAVLTIAVFWRELAQLMLLWVYDPFVRYGFLVPPISVYMMWRRRTAVAQNFDNIEAGLSLMLFSLPVLLLTRAYASISMAVVAFLPFVFGLVIAAYAWPGLRKVWFPIAYLGFMFPFPPVLTTGLSLWLSRLTYQLTRFWLDILGVRYSSVYETVPTICVFHTGQPLRFGLDISCLSVYSVLGFLAFGIFLAYVLSANLYKRVVLVLVGLLALVILNSVRIAAILGLATAFGEGPAVAAFHFLGGWVLILVSVLIVFALTARSGARIDL